VLRLAARWVLPVCDAPIRDGAVLVGDDGRIAAVGPDAAVPRPGSADTRDLADAVLLPGLVNTHAHLELTALRGLVTDRPFPRWVAAVRRLKDALPAGDFEAAARWGVLEGFAAGITATGDTGSTGAAARAMAVLGARGIACQEVFGPDPGQCQASLAGLRAALAALAPLASARLAIGISPHAPYTVSTALLAATAALAAAEGYPVAMHVAESEEESRFVTDGEGPFADHLRGRGIAVVARETSPVGWALDGGLGPLRPLLIHCVHLDDEDRHRIAAAPASVAHCPWSNTALGTGRADLRALRAAGVTVGLGTDSVAAGRDLDLFTEARLASDGLPMEARAVLGLITSDAAAALGLRGTGRLAPGAWGDATAVRLPGLADTAAEGIEARLVAEAQPRQVAGTWVAGRCVYRDGVWPGVDAGTERRHLDEASDRARTARAAVTTARPAGRPS
jgi:cytosine/adenosine deaminase-related metal-dependent hydrolase